MILVQGLSIVFEKIKLLLYFCHYIWYQIRDLQEPMYLTNLSISPNQLTSMMIYNSSNNAVDHYPSLKTSYCLLIMLLSLLVSFSNINHRKSCSLGKDLHSLYERTKTIVKQTTHISHIQSIHGLICWFPWTHQWSYLLDGCWYQF